MNYIGLYQIRTQESNDFLMHYGISGQRWHIRRFQTEGGKLTEAGKERYGHKTGSDRKHDKKEAIREKALSENSEKIQFHDSAYKDWKKEEARVKRNKSKYEDKDDYDADLADARRNARISKDRTDAWKRREKWLMDMKLDDLSVRDVKKATKLKWHERFYPSAFEE